MNDSIANSQVAPLKIGRILFIGILALHVLSCYILGFTGLANWPYALETGFGIPYSPELDIIGNVIGLELLFLGTIAVLGIIWTRKGSIPGIIVGTAVGVYMFVFGIVAFLLLGETDGLLIDSIRGFLTFVFGYMAYTEIKNNNA